MKTLKMVRGSSYVVPGLNNGRPVTKGDVIHVDRPEVAAMILADGYLDSANNFHTYFDEVEVAVEAQATNEVDDSEDAEPAAKPIRRGVKAK